LFPPEDSRLLMVLPCRGRYYKSPKCLSDCFATKLLGMLSSEGIGELLLIFPDIRGFCDEALPDWVCDEFFPPVFEFES